MLEDNRLDPDKRLQIRAQATLGLAAHLLLQRGEEKVVRLLLDVIRLETYASDDRFDDDRLWLEVAPEHLGAFDKPIVDKIRDACSEIDQRRNYQIYLPGFARSCPRSVPTGRRAFASS